MGTSLTLVRQNASVAGAHVASQHWAWCAPFLATDRVRLSRDGGRTYPRRSERALTRQLPDEPAAVRIYSGGTTRVFVADFDVTKADQATVDRDADAFAELVHRLGGRTLSDQSPTGGRHVYVPLAVPVPWTLARRVAQALETRYLSFDKMPMVNQTDGLIRPPGSPHPAGGWQVLVTSREDAIRALSSRTSQVVFDKLARTVGVDPEGPAPILSAVEGVEWLQALSAAPLKGRRRRRLAHEWEVMATTGIRPASWPSDSEARLALLRACARHGWVFADVVARFESGDWPGLRRLYERYQPQQVRAAMARDWRKAMTPDRLTATTAGPDESTARRIDTRDPLTHPLPSPQASPEEIYSRIRDWWTVLKEVEKTRWPMRGGLSVRRVLRAIGGAAQKGGSSVVSFGVRSLAEASGLDHSTVAAVLKQLREEVDPFLVRVREAEGLEADGYELRVPTAHEELTRTRWRPGRIEGVHPLFRTVGGAGYLVWEVLAAAGEEPVVSFDIAQETGVAVRTVQETLIELGELGLVERRGQGWAVAGSLDAAAVAVGADDAHAAVMVEHRRARAMWRGVLRKVVLDRGSMRWWEQEPPPELEWTDPGQDEARWLLSQQLGAVVA